MTITAADTVLVELTEPEVQMVAFEAARRVTEALRERQRPAHGAAPGPNIYTDVIGCCGEFGVCKHLGLFWSGVGSRKVDVGGHLQVRTADHHSKRLIVRTCDGNADAFVLVTLGRTPHPHTALVVAIRGWLLGCDAKQPEFWRTEAGREPAFFVPAEELHPMHSLRMEHSNV